MTLRSTSIVCLVLASASLLGACGGDDNSDSGGLSSNEKLLVIQARGDIGEFCSVADTGNDNELFDRNFEAMLTGVRDLARSTGTTRKRRSTSRSRRRSSRWSR